MLIHKWSLVFFYYFFSELVSTGYIKNKVVIIINKK